jgi:hypothetical protein
MCVYEMISLITYHHQYYPAPTHDVDDRISSSNNNTATASTSRTGGDEPQPRLGVDDDRALHNVLQKGDHHVLRLLFDAVSALLVTTHD